MTTLQIIITLLAVSALLNVVAIWYIRNILTKLFFVSNNLGEVSEVLGEFAKHIDSVHSMETFYGDQTLQGLLKHARLVTEMLQEFEEIYEITEGYEHLENLEEEVEEVEEVENEEGEVAHGDPS
jgi:hypothetical protein